MIVLQAPHSLIQTTTVLPNPTYQDAVSLVNKLNNKTMMNGAKRVYVRSTPKQKIEYEFEMCYPKALELQAFVEAYEGVEWRLIDMENRVWRVIHVPDVFELVKERETLVRASLSLEGYRIV